MCDIEGCDKKFGRNCELTRHKLNHMDVWPFSCEWPGCGRKFKRKDVFKNHQRTHRKEDGADGPASAMSGHDDVHDGHDDDTAIVSQAALRAQLQSQLSRVQVQMELEDDGAEYDDGADDQDELVDDDQDADDDEAMHVDVDMAHEHDDECDHDGDDDDVQEPSEEVSK